jgi:hypothetical protein
VLCASLADLPYHRAIPGAIPAATRTPTGGGAPAGDRAAWLCSLAVAAAVVAFAAFQYAMPAEVHSSWGVNPEGAAHFRTALRLPAWALEPTTFRRGFLALVALMAAAYLGLLAATGTGAAPPTARVARLAGALVIVLAALAPPALSPDVYAYVGYARLALVHHLNPYVATQRALVELSDVTAPFLRWPIASPYGPLWMIACIAVEAALRAAPLWVAVVALKLVGGAAVLAVAELGRRLAEALAPGGGARAFACIALNPILLVEGAGSGHNDVVMMAGVMLALLLAARERHTAAFAVVGLATAVKFLPLLLVPWLVLVASRGAPLARRLRVALAAAALGLLPSLLSYAAFGRGAHLLDGLRARLATGHPATRGGHPLRDAAALAVVYAALSVWIARGDLARVLRAWVGQSFLVFFLAAGIWFPWYLTWPLAPALVLPRAKDASVAALLFCTGCLLMIPYVL